MQKNKTNKNKNKTHISSFKKIYIFSLNLCSFNQSNITIFPQKKYIITINFKIFFTIVKFVSCDWSLAKCGIGKIDFILLNHNLTS